MKESNKGSAAYFPTIRIMVYCFLLCFVVESGPFFCIHDLKISLMGHRQKPFAVFLPQIQDFRPAQILGHKNVCSWHESLAIRFCTHQP